MKTKVEYFVAPKDSRNESLTTLFLFEAREYHSKVGGSLTKHTSMFFTKQDITNLYCTIQYKTLLLQIAPSSESNRPRQTCDGKSTYQR